MLIYLGKRHMYVILIKGKESMKSKESKVGSIWEGLEREKKMERNDVIKL